MNKDSAIEYLEDIREELTSIMLQYNPTVGQVLDDIDEVISHIDKKIKDIKKKEMQEWSRYHLHKEKLL